MNFQFSKTLADHCVLEHYCSNEQQNADDAFLHLISVGVWNEIGEETD